MIGILIFLLGYLAGVTVASLRSPSRREPRYVPQADLLERYHQNFLTCTLPIPTDKREDFLIWMLKNHEQYGKWLEVELSPDGDLFTYCFSNDEALSAAREIAGYKYPIVLAYPVDAREGELLVDKTKRIFDGLREDEKPSVDIVRRKFATMDWEFVCVDPMFAELADKFVTIQRSEILQEGAMA